jgi:predicted PurR-regulated permease PerM
VNAFLQVWRNPYVRVVVYVLALYVAYLLLREIGSVVILAGLAYLFAYLFHPIVDWLERRRLPRALGLGVAFLAVIVFLTFATVLIANIVNELVQFTQKLPTLVQGVERQVNVFVDQLEQVRGQNEQLRGVIDQVTNGIEDALSRIVSSLLGVIQNFGSGLVTRTLGVLGGVVQFFLVLVVGTYMLSSFKNIGQTLLELFPKRWQPGVLDFSKDVSTAVGGYVRGQLVIAASVGVMVGVGLWILGIPLALGLGFLSAVFNVVPYLGVIISIAPALLLASQFGLIKVLLVVLVFIIANQVEAHFLSPNILARTTDLHPITVILTILVGASLLGIFGGLLAVPLVALGKLLIRKHWLNSRLHDEGAPEGIGAHVPLPSEQPTLEPNPEPKPERA